jgi:hypothetical protein
MRIDINKIKQGFYVLGEPTDEIKEWAYVNKLLFEKSGDFTNILIEEGTNIDELFEI